MTEENQKRSPFFANKYLKQLHLTVPNHNVFVIIFNNSDHSISTSNHNIIIYVTIKDIWEKENSLEKADSRT